MIHNVTSVGDISLTGTTLLSAAAEVSSAVASGAGGFGDDSGNFATASAEMNMNAGGNLAAGGITVNASADVSSATFIGSSGTTGAASAFADLFVNAVANVTMTGDIAVMADAEFSVTAGSAKGDTARADALLEVDAGDSIAISGNVNVAADANMAVTGTTYAFGYSASALADAEFNAPGAIGVSGNVTVTGTALNTAVAGLTASSPTSVYATASYAFGFAYLDVGSSTTPSVINISGVTTVTADAGMFASATADLSGAGSAASVTAYGYSGSAYASADLNASVSVTTGAITIDGTMLQTAIATATGTGAANILASSGYYDDAYAYLFIDAAAGDITINGDVELGALADLDASAGGGAGATGVDAITSWDYGSAWANLNAGSLININGTVTITGTVLNNAVATATATTPADVYAYVYGGTAEAYLYVGNNTPGAAVDISGAINVDATIDMSASANADLSGTGSAASILASNSYGVATASADLNAVNSITTGDITVSGTKLQTAIATATGNGPVDVLASNASYDNASAYLDMDVGAGAGNNITVNGSIAVTALDEFLASAHGGAGATSVEAINDSSAYAQASANLDAGGLIAVTGNITVTGSANQTALVTVTGGSPGNILASNYYGSAYGYLYMGNTRAADIDVTGDIEVSAHGDFLASVAGDVLDNASAFASAYNSYGVYVSASADLSAADSVTLNDITVTGTELSTALNTVKGIGVDTAYASADSGYTNYAYLYVTANGTGEGDGVHIMGDMVVTAHTKFFASVDGSAAEIASATADVDEYASAYASINAATIVDIDGNITVTGAAFGTANVTLANGGPLSDAYADASTASAFAYLKIGTASSVDVIDIAGATLVDARVEVSASVNANVSGSAGSPATVEAEVANGDATASADLRATNSVTTGDITVNGTVLQTALATATGTGAASVLALNTSFSDATAELNITGGDVTINGNIVLDARNEQLGSAIGGAGATVVRASADSASASASGSINGANIDLNGNVTVTGTVLTTAHAETTAATPVTVEESVYGGTADAYFYVGFSVATDIDIAGDVLVTATNITSGASHNSTGSAKASASFNADNNITMGGGVTVAALSSATDATDDGYYPNASADLVMNAGNNLDIGAITVSGDATLIGGSLSGAFAYVTADLDAGANVTINGGISVTADALSDGTNYSSQAFARANLFVDAGNDGPGDLVVNGATLVTATAVSRRSVGSAAKAYASASAAFAGDTIDITGDMKVSASATRFGKGGNDASGLASLEVIASDDVTITGNITVTGTADNTVIGSSGGSAIGIGELVIAAGTDGTFEGDLLFGEGSLTVNGDVTVTGNATMTGSGGMALGLGDAEFMAGGDITINSSIGGGITVLSSAVADGGATLALAGLDAEAFDLGSTHTMLTISAGLDSAEIFAIGGDVTVTGEIIVSASARLDIAGASATSGSTFSSRLGEDAVAMAIAKIEANSGFSASGDVAMTGGITVDADASLTVGDLRVSGSVSESNGSASFIGFAKGAAGAAEAFAILEIAGDGDIVLSGNLEADADAIATVGNIVVTGTAHADGSEGAGANATFVGFAGLISGAGTAESPFEVAGAVIEGAEAVANIDIQSDNGDVSLTGDSLVTADATVTFGDITVSGAATASGDSLSDPSATFIGFAGNVVEGADAGFNVSAAGEVTVMGGVNVAAVGDVSFGDITISGAASADAFNTDVVATAEFIAFGVMEDETGSSIGGGSLTSGGAAVADVSITAGGTGNATVTGSVTVTADFGISLGDIAITGDAVAIAGPTGFADALVQGFHSDAIASFDEASSVNALVNLAIEAPNNVAVGGDIVLDAVTDFSVGNVAVTGASRVIESGGNAVVAGAVAFSSGSGSAFATFEGFDNDLFGQSAEAVIETVNIEGGGNVTLDGAFIAMAVANATAGDIAISGGAFAFHSGNVSSFNSVNAVFEGIGSNVFDGGAVAQAGTSIGDMNIRALGGGVTINDDVIVSADANFTVGDITITGRALAASSGTVASTSAFVSATFRGIDNAVAGGDTLATADLDIRAVGAGNNVNLTGNISVTADATQTAGDLAIAGTASAFLSGQVNGSSTNANTGFAFVNAQVEGVGEVLGDDASARADLLIDSFGDITVVGNVTVAADADATVGDVVVTGNALALTDLSGSGSSNRGSAIADFEGIGNDVINRGAFARGKLKMSASGSVAINVGAPLNNVTVTGDALVTVGDVTFGGIANATVTGSSGGGSPSLSGAVARADVEGVDDDVIGGDANGSADLIIQSVGDDVRIDSDLVVAATARESVGAITVNGAAFGSASGDNLGSRAFADAEFDGVDGGSHGRGHRRGRRDHRRRRRPGPGRRHHAHRQYDHDAGQPRHQRRGDRRGGGQRRGHRRLPGHRRGHRRRYGGGHHRGRHRGRRRPDPER